MGDEVTSVHTASSGGSIGSGETGHSQAQPPSKGILTNAHEAQKKSAKQADSSSLRSALKAAFVVQQPGKLMKTNGKPLGKSFERQQPLPQKHEGAEVLKVDPRGEKASVGDGIVLSPTGGDDADLSALALSSSESGLSGSEKAFGPMDSSSEKDAASSSSDSRRGRSDTVSSGVPSSSRSPSIASTTASNHCQIKFAPLPTSGRLKRANSITIGVAARSQLLHSQGGGRANGGSQQQQGGGRPSGQGMMRTAETVDLGEELRKGASKAWNRVRRGSSVSSASSGDGAAGSNSSAANGKGIAMPNIEAVKEEEQSAEPVTGEKTPKRSGSPVHMSTFAGLEEEPEGARTPRHSMQRRVSTGAFIGAQSFREMEEKRKREHRSDEDVEQYATPTEEHQDSSWDDELSAQFVEKLGRTGASRELHHTGNQSWIPSFLSRSDGPQKDTDIVRLDNEAATDTSASSRSSTDDEAAEGATNTSEDDRNEDEDDEESREAQRLADEALKGHSAKATKAGGVEKMERKGSALSRLVGA